MRRFLAAFLVAGALGPAAFGQIIYENVRYQHTSAAGQTYYYAGSEPRTFYWAELQSELTARDFGRRNTIGFSGGVGRGDGLLNPRTPIYTDLVPFSDASRWGFTVDDARNEAVRSAPLYFRKADLLRAAEVQPDGTVVVPSHPRMVVIVDRKRSGDNGDGTTRPATSTTGRILIIPKPKPAKSDNAIVASR